MITKDETGLTQTEYDATKEQSAPLAKRVTVSRYNLDFADHDTTGSGTYNFDVYVNRNENALYRAQLDGTTLTCKRLPNEWSGDQSWQACADIDTGVDAIRPSWGAFNCIFYVKNGNIWRASTSDQGASWSTGEIIDLASEGIDGEVTNVAGSGDYEVFFAVYRDDYNTNLLHAVSPDLSTWTPYDSGIYLPHPLTGFDAKEVSFRSIGDSTTLVVLTTDLPVQIATRVEGTELATIAMRRNGVLAFLHRARRWSEHFVVEQFDDASDYQYRSHCFLATLTPLGKPTMFAVSSYGVDGNENYNHAAVHYSFSANGKFWSQHELMTITDQEGGALCAVNGKHTYLCSPTTTRRSLTTALTGSTPADEVQEDITSRITKWQSNASSGRSSSFEVRNDDDWYATSILANGGLFTVKTEFGVYLAGAPAYFQMSDEFVNSHGRSKEMPSHTIGIKSTDASGRIGNDVRSTQAVLSDTQTIGIDRFIDESDTGYGGLSHVSPDSGSWASENNSLVLRSNNKYGVARNAFNINIWNGIIQAGVKVSDPAGTGLANDFQYAGLIFRGYDKGNFYSVEWEIGVSQCLIYLYEVRAGEKTTIAVTSSSELQFDAITYLRIAYRYGHVRVDLSSDAREWTNKFDLILPGKEPAQSGHFLSGEAAVADAMLEQGFSGYVGKGYSAEDTWTTDPFNYGPDQEGTISPLTALPDVGGGTGTKSAFISLNVERVYDGTPYTRGVLAYTRDVVNGPWATLQSGLPVTDTYGVPLINYANLDFWDADTLLVNFMNGGFYKCPNWRNGSSWQALVTEAELEAAVQAVFPSIPDSMFVGDVAFSMAEQGTFFLTVQWADSDFPAVLVQLKNYGQTINVAPYQLAIDDSGSAKTDFARWLNVKASNVDGDTCYVVACRNPNVPGTKEGGFFKIEWDNWNTMSDGGTTYIASQVYLASDRGNNEFGVFVPYYDRNGDVNNPENEIYITGVNQHIRRSLNGGLSFTQWTEVGHYPDNNDTLSTWQPRMSGRDMFETAGNHDTGVAYFVSPLDGNALYVLNNWAAAYNESGWTKYSLGAKYGWCGGWPYRGGQFYIGIGRRGCPYVESSIVAKMTTDITQGLIDITHNLTELPAYAGGAADTRGHTIVRLTPHWSET